MGDKQKRKSTKKSKKVDSSSEKTQLDENKTEKFPEYSDKSKKSKISKEIKAKNNEQERNIRIKENEESFVVSKENSQPQIEKHLIQMEHKTENTTIQNIDSEAQSSIRPTSIDKEDNGSTVESSKSVSVCSLVDREQTSQTVLPNDAKQTINPVKAEKVIE